MLKILFMCASAILMSFAVYAGDFQKQFEGLYMDSGGPTIIKEFPDFALYAGYDKESAWSGKCVKVKEVYKCVGDTYNAQGTLRIEVTTFKLVDDGVLTEWEITDKDGTKSMDSSLLKKLK